MIARWSRLQLPLGNGSAFAPPPPSMAGRPAFREQSLLLCGAYGDRGGLDSFCFPDLRATLVGNLIGALVNATEILDEYAGYPEDSEVNCALLAFEASAQDRDLAASGDSPSPNESLQLLLHERLNSDSCNGSSVSASFDKAAAVPDLLRHYATIDDVVLPSATLPVGGEFRGKHKLSLGSTTHRAEDGHGSLYHSMSEEDFLLKQARFKDYRRKVGPNATKKTSSVETSGNSLVNVLAHGSKQARNAVLGLAKSSTGYAEAGETLFFKEVRGPCQQNSVFWGSVALGMLLTGVLFVTWGSNFFRGRRRQAPSIKRRILKSQWYENHGSLPLCEHKNFQMKISEFPKYNTLEVDGDRKKLRFPSDLGLSASLAKKESQRLLEAQTPTINSVQGVGANQASVTERAQGLRMRQMGHSDMPTKRQDGSGKMHPGRILNGASAEPLPEDRRGHHGLQGEKKTFVSQPRVSGFQGRRINNTAFNDTSHKRFSRMNISKSRTDRREWGQEDELDLDHRIQKLYQTIQAVEQHRRTAMLALEEEKQRSLALEQEMSKQREAAAVLKQEVRQLKESHHALLASLQKKYSTPAAARTAADLVYQDWERHVAAE